jgi:subfamily B ATP-binding cassette protein MsbA
MKGLKEVFRLAFSQKKSAYLTIISNLFYVIFNLISLVLFIPFLNLIFNPEISNGVAVKTLKPSWETKEDIFIYFGDYYDFVMQSYIDTNGRTGALTFICVTVLIAFFLKNVFKYGAVYHQSFLRIAVVRDLRQALFSKAIRLPLAYHSEEKKGDLLSRMTSDLNEIEVALVFVLEIIFREPIAITISLSFLYYISPQLTLFSFILIPISGLIITRIGKSLKKTSNESQEQMGTLLSRIEEAIGGVRIIKAFSAEKESDGHFKNDNETHQKLSTSTFRKRDLASPLNEFFSAAVLMGIVWFGGKLILDAIDSGVEGDLNGEQFITFIVIFSQLLRPISTISKGLSALKKAEASLDRINHILDIPETIKDPINPIIKTKFNTEIKFNNVEFAYNDTTVINKINFTIKKGQSVALVGESGSGKSTISDLIPRFYDVTSGEIMIDNTNIKDLTTNNLREFISIVTQESILFNESVENNIKFGNPNATKEQIIEAAKIANAHDFIEDLENGYNTNIGDRGNKLSGGQKQRVSIARAILSQAPIMILDEATSALDTESEKEVQNALDNLMKNRTSLVIAHRLSTIRNADTIIVLKKGVIVEQGNHKELIALDGYYRSLCEIQQVI